MHTLVSGLVLVSCFYIAIAVIIGRGAGVGWAVVYLAALPPSASLDFWVSDRWRRARARARAYRFLRANPHRRAELRANASAIRAEARRLDALLR